MSFGRKCRYVNCGIYGIQAPSKKFFRFPNDPQRRAIWSEYTGVKDASINNTWNYKGIFICQDHFDENSFQDKGKTVLKMNAVPIPYDSNLIKSKSNVFSCKSCGAGFPSQASVDEHGKNCYLYGPYTCDHCGVKFALRHSFLKHRDKCLEPKRCVVARCPSNSEFDTEMNPVKTFPLPWEKKLRQAWLNIIPISTSSPPPSNKSFFVCMKHFKKRDFVQKDDYKLHPKAVPSIFDVTTRQSSELQMCDIPDCRNFKKIRESVVTFPVPFDNIVQKALWNEEILKTFKFFLSVGHHLCIEHFKKDDIIKKYGIKYLKYSAVPRFTTATNSANKSDDSTIYISDTDDDDTEEEEEEEASALDTQNVVKVQSNGYPTIQDPLDTRNLVNIQSNGYPEIQDPLDTQNVVKVQSNGYPKIQDPLDTRNLVNIQSTGCPTIQDPLDTRNVVNIQSNGYPEIQDPLDTRNVVNIQSNGHPEIQDPLDTRNVVNIQSNGFPKIQDPLDTRNVVNIQSNGYPEIQDPLDTQNVVNIQSNGYPTIRYPLDTRNLVNIQSNGYPKIQHPLDTRNTVNIQIQTVSDTQNVIKVQSNGSPTTINPLDNPILANIQSNISYSTTINLLDLGLETVCCVPGCNRVPQLGVSFHKFPPEGETPVELLELNSEKRPCRVIKDLRTLWMERVGISEVTPTTFICTNHFTANDYVRAPGRSLRSLTVRLARYAVPSRKLPPSPKPIKGKMFINFKLDKSNFLFNKSKNETDKSRIETPRCTSPAVRAVMANLPSIAPKPTASLISESTEFPTISPVKSNMLSIAPQPVQPIKNALLIQLKTEDKESDDLYDSQGVVDMLLPCSIVYCDSHKLNLQSRVMFKLPNDKERAQKWAEICGYPQWLDQGLYHARKHVRLCSLHFKPEMFGKGSKSNRLTKDAMPELLDPLSTTTPSISNPSTSEPPKWGVGNTVALKMIGVYAKCTVSCCENYCDTSKPEYLGQNYFKFPEHKALRLLWIDAIRKGANWEPGSAIICSQHFPSGEIIAGCLRPKTLPTFHHRNKLRPSDIAAAKRAGIGVKRGPKPKPKVVPSKEPNILKGILARNENPKEKPKIPDPPRHSFQAAMCTSYMRSSGKVKIPKLHKPSILSKKRKSKVNDINNPIRNKRGRPPKVSTNPPNYSQTSESEVILPRPKEPRIIATEGEVILPRPEEPRIIAAEGEVILPRPEEPRMIQNYLNDSNFPKAIKCYGPRKKKVFMDGSRGQNFKSVRIVKNNEIMEKGEESQIDEATIDIDELHRNPALEIIKNEPSYDPLSIDLTEDEPPETDPLAMPPFKRIKLGPLK